MSRRGSHAFRRRVGGAVVLLCALLSGCYAKTAARHSGELAASGWDRDTYGNWVAITGPGMSLAAVGDFAARSVIPEDYFPAARSEPEQKWFRFYTGPMQPLEDVAVLCNRERATTVTTIRSQEQERATYARHQKWHYPQCIEVLPGTYELKIDFYSRETFPREFSVATYSTESTSPATVTWTPQAGGIYQLSALLGDVSPSPNTAYSGTTIKRLTRTKTKLGASEFTLDEGHWVAIVEPVPDLDAIGFPVLEQREAWRKYELRRRKR